MAGRLTGIQEEEFERRFGYDGVPVKNGYFAVLRVRSVEDYGKFNFTFFQIGVDADVFNMIFRHRFAPHGLPKAALPRIPDFSPVQHLLSVRFIACVCVVGNGRGNFVFALVYEAGDVEIKRPIAARMTARNFAADMHGTMLAYIG